MYSLSVVERDWLLRRSEGLKRVRSLKLQLFWTLAGLVPSVPASATGDRRSLTDDVCLFLMLWPRGLANLTRSLKLNFWLKSERRTAVGDRLSFSLTTWIIRDFWRGVVFFLFVCFDTILEFASHRSSNMWRVAGRNEKDWHASQQVPYRKCKLRLGVMLQLCYSLLAWCYNRNQCRSGKWLNVAKLEFVLAVRDPL